MIDDPELAAALDIAVARTGHRRYRDLCDPSHPDYNPDYIPIVLGMAAGPWPPPRSGPALATQARNLARAMWDWAVSGFRMATEEEQARRLAICRTCEWFAPDQMRCRHKGCGCFVELKVRLRSSHCPIRKW